MKFEFIFLSIKKCKYFNLKFLDKHKKERKKHRKLKKPSHRRRRLSLFSISILC
jgi:hypothetical protein